MPEDPNGTINGFFVRTLLLPDLLLTLNRYHERPNRNFSTAQIWAFKHIPLYNRLFRFWLFAVNDSLAGLYAAGPESVKHRNAVEIQAKEYIYDHTPPKYHSFIAPDFPLGMSTKFLELQCQ